MEKSTDDSYLDIMSKKLDEICNSGSASKELKDIFKVFTKSRAKNKNWRENFKVFIWFLESSYDVEFEQDIEKVQILLPKDKVRNGKIKYSSVQLDEIKEAQIIIGPNPYLQNGFNKGITYVDVKPQEYTENLYGMDENIEHISQLPKKLRFLNKDKKIVYSFEPELNNVNQTVELFSQHIKITYVNNKFLIQSLPNSIKTHICLLNSQIIHKQIFQVKKTMIQIALNKFKLELTYSIANGNKIKENVDKETVFYMENDMLTTELLDKSKKFLRVYKVENKWNIETLTGERNLFRLLHNLDTKKNGNSSHPLLLNDGMLFNFNGEFLQLRIE